MEFEEALTAAVKHIVFRFIRPNTNATVISVDKLKNTCNVAENGTDFKVNNVMLMSVEDDFAKKLVVYPKVGSTVGIAFLWRTSNKAQVIKYSEVDEILLNGDEFGGMVKVGALVGRINDLENAHNDLVSKWNSFCSSYAPGSPASVGTPPTLSTQTLEPINNTTVEHIENPKVKHG